MLQRQKGKLERRAKSDTTLASKTKDAGDTMKKIFAIAALFAATVAGTAFAAGQYDLKVTAPSSAKLNQKAEAKVTVTAKEGWKINGEYPAKFTLVEADGVTFEKNTLKKADAAKFDDHTAEWSVALTAASAGKKQIKGELKFAVCDNAKTSCIPCTEKVTFAVDAK